jgi:hypothetical protein
MRYGNLHDEGLIPPSAFTGSSLPIDNVRIEEFEVFGRVNLLLFSPWR